ncbi:MAG: sulfite exporter TauE/SafE family protein [Coriobacteriia bacterium]|nr:sulfite exporter TauE/SafE family protein [Coriobacteriia bacterium]
MGGEPVTVAVGLVSGVLSGMFGIGGGVVTTPAIRLLLGYPALIAVGTPLPVILPGAVTGAISYARRGLADVRAGLVMGGVGVIGSVAGALLSRVAGGSTVLIVTSLFIGWVAVDLVLQARAARAVAAASALLGEVEADPEAALAPAPGAGSTDTGLVRLAAIGVCAGLFSGFLGLGGGFVVVPALTRVFGMPVKRAIGTSLVTVAVLAVPGSVMHWFLGNIDARLAVLLAVGVVPGALIGARLAARASDRTLRLAFGALLLVVGVWLAGSEIAGIGA